MHHGHQFFTYNLRATPQSKHAPWRRQIGGSGAPPVQLGFVQRSCITRYGTHGVDRFDFIADDPTPVTQKHPAPKQNFKPLPPTEAAAVLQEFDRALRKDMDATLARMRAEGGKIVLNSDDLFKMLPRYKNNPGERIFLGPLLYPVAKKFIDDVYKKLLKRPVARDDTVVFTAGGSATGKSTILRAASQKPGVDFIVDTTFSDAPRAMAQVEQALARKRKVEIHYVYRDFAESALGMVRRALDPASGRIVPIDDMARTHFGAQRSVLEALMTYQDEPRVSIKLKVKRKAAGDR